MAATVAAMAASFSCLAAASFATPSSWRGSDSPASAVLIRRPRPSRSRASPLRSDLERWDRSDPDKLAYNDGALKAFHMLTQAQKIRDYSAMDTYVDTASLWDQAWHDSFVRNGLSDFVPPLTDNLDVLVVGSRYQAREDGGLAAAAVGGGRTGFDSGDDDDDDAAPTVISLAGGGTEPSAAGSPLQVTPAAREDSSCSFLASIFDDDDPALMSVGGSGDLDVESYDCIMDRGLLAGLFGSDGGERSEEKDAARLLYEATRRLRDCGIYVASTPPLSQRAKEYLTRAGERLGLQWVFDLDGISDDKVSVNVARKYFKDELPPGWQSFWARGLREEDE